MFHFTKGNTISDLLLQNENDSQILRFIEGKQIKEMTYGQLKEKAKDVAGCLQRRGVEKGERICILFSSPSEFLPIFWGSILCGVSVIPMVIKKQEEGAYPVQKLEKLLEVAKVDRIIGELEECGELKECSKGQYLAFTQLQNEESDYHEVELMEDEPSILLFTSGSTGMSKVIPLTHKNIMTNLAGQIKFHELSEKDKILNWLPLEHSEALIQFHLLPMALGAQQVQINTELILANPVKWLEYLTRYKITVSWAPNFFYEVLSLEKIERESDNIDLSGIRYLINTGETVTKHACQKFTEIWEKKGIHTDSIRPGWGMTETGGAVIFAKERSKSPQFEDFVASGIPIPGIEMKVTKEKQQKGELLVRGTPVIALERGKQWLYTGDYAAIIEGELVVYGRKKELLIINGENYSCVEIEDYLRGRLSAKVQSVICTEVKVSSGVEMAVCFFVVKKPGYSQAEVAEKIKQVMIRDFGFTYELLIFLEEKEILRTAIGKVKRRKMGLMVQEKQYVPYFVSKKWSKFFQDAQMRKQQMESREGEGQQLLAIWKRVLKVEDLTEEDDFFLSGGNSAKIPLIVEEMSLCTGQKIEPTDLLDHPTVQRLWKWLKKNEDALIIQQKEATENIDIVEI